MAIMRTVGTVGILPHCCLHSIDTWLPRGHLKRTRRTHIVNSLYELCRRRKCVSDSSGVRSSTMASAACISLPLPLFLSIHSVLAPTAPVKNFPGSAPMDAGNPKHGVTGPTTLRESTPEAVELSKKLAEYLEQANFFESEESAQTRERVLGRLDFLVKRFVDSTAPQQSDKQTGGKIFTFGSYRLGVHDRGADIDTLCVVPRHVHRADFFSTFYDHLKADPSVSDLSKVEDAYVPLIKMKFSGIPIDMTFARLQLPVVRENLSLLNDSLLRSMDEKCIVSLNGSRVTDAMLNLVPCVEVFHTVLRAIKFWAKRRFVYGASYGYFGGVAFAIAVARICQMHPNYAAYDLLRKFFETYSAWKWPNPVTLCPIVDLNYHHKIWDPKTYPADKYDKMPVITPAYPSMCSTHNVTQSTYHVIMAEFSRANELLRASPSASFSELFQFTDFFRKYKLFVEAAIQCTDREEYLMWNGYIESRIRILATKLEGAENVTQAIPFPKAFKTEASGDASEADGTGEKKAAQEHGGDADDDAPGKRRRLTGHADNGHIEHMSTDCKSAQQAETEVTDPVRPAECWRTSFFVAVDVSVASKTTGKKLYIDDPIKEFLDFVNSWEKKTANMSVKITATKKKEIQRFLRTFQDAPE